MSIVRWRNILLNWINCCDEATDWSLHPDRVLHRILEQLQSSSLDHSASLEAQTLDEFIRDKYPQFKFENGTSHPTTEEDICMAASLLLLFVCVQSKDTDMRDEMCSKLKREDQEVILKFTKNLMTKSQVTYEDVCAAIIESSGERASGLCSDAANTPPPLRALHGEVRRLRAALAAERFDRAYLQDELLATNEKLHKLAMDKESYQKEMVSLRAQLSATCPSPAAREGDEGERECEEAGRRALARQLSALEERLVDAQERYDDCERSRQICKKKMEEMKRERDKWLEWGQEESERACSLAEQLEAERAAAAALREMNAELRTHRRRLDDSGLLECDDGDSPPERSFAQDSSVCGDVCAGVVEVQLCEERARTTRLSLQLQSLEDKIKVLEIALIKKENEIKTELEQKIKLQDKLDENNNEIRNISAKMNNLKVEKDMLENKIMDYHNHVTSSRSVIAKLTADNEELKDIAKETARTMNCKVEEIEGKNEALQKQLRQLKKEAETYSRETTDQIEKLKAEKELFQHKIEDLGNIISSFQLEKSEIVAKYDQIKASADQTIESLSEKHIIFSETIKERNATIEDLHIQMKQITLDYQDKIKIIYTKAEESTLKLEDQINICENIISSNKAEIEELLSQNKEIQAKTEETALMMISEINELIESKISLENRVVECAVILSDKDRDINQLGNEIDELNEKIKVLEKALLEKEDEMKIEIGQKVELQYKLDDNNNEIRNISAKMDSLEVEKHMLEKKITEFENHITSNKSLITELTKENKELKGIARTMNLKVEEIECQNEELKIQFADLKKEAEEYSRNTRNQIDKLKSERKSFENKIEELSNIITFFQLEKEEMVTKYGQMKANTDQTIQSLSESKVTIDELQIQQIELQNQIKQITANYQEKIELVNAKAEKSTAKLQSQISAYENIISAKEVEIEQLLNKNREVQAKVEQTAMVMKREITELQEAKISLGNKLVEGGSVLSDKERQVTKLEKEIEELNTKLKELVIALIEKDDVIKSEVRQKSELQNMFDENNNVMRNISAKMNNLEAEKEILEKKIEDFESHVTSNTSLIAKLTNENRELKAIAKETNKTMNCKVKENEDKYDALKLQMAQIKKEAGQYSRDLTVEIEHLKAEKESLQHKIEELENIITSCQLEKAEMLTKYDQLIASTDQTIQSLSEKHAMHSETIKEKNATIAELQIRINEITEDYQKKIELMTADAEKSTAKLESQVSLCEDIISAKKVEIEQLLSKNKEIQAKAEETATAMINKMKELEATKHSLENQVIESASFLSGKETQIMQLQNETHELNEKVKVLEIALIRKEDDVKIKVEQQLELQSKLDENNNLMTKISTKMKNLEVKKDMLEKKIMDFENRITSNISLLAKLNDENKELKYIATETIRTINCKVKQSTDENDALAMQYAQFKIVTEEYARDLSDQIDKLKADKVSFQRKIDELENIITTCQIEKSEMQAKYYQIKTSTDQTIQSLSEKHAICSETIKEKNAIIKELETQQVELQNQIKQMTVENQEKIDLITANAKESTAKFEGQVSEMQAKYDQIKNITNQTIQSLSEKHAMCSETIKEKNAIIEELKTQQVELQNQIKQITVENQEKIDLITANAKESTAKFEGQVSEMQAKYDQTKIITNQTIQSLSEKHAMCSETIKEKNEIIKELKTQQVELQNQYKTVENQEKIDLITANAKESTAKFEGQVSEMQAKYDQIKIITNQTIQSLSEKHAMCSETIKEKNEIIKELKTQQVELQNQIKQMTVENQEKIDLITANAKESTAKFEGQVSEMQAKYDQIKIITNQTIQSLSEKHAMCSETIKEKNAIIEELKTQQVELQNQIKQMTVENQEKIDLITANAKESTAKFEGQVSEMQAKYDQIKNITNQTIQSLSEKHAMCSETIKEKNEIIEELKTQQVELQNQIKQMTVENQEKIDLITANAKESTAKFEGQVSEMQAKYDQTKIITNQTIQSLSEKHALCSEIIKEKNEIIEELKTQQVELQNKIKQMTVENQEKIGLMTANAKELTAVFERQISECENIISAKKVEVEQLLNRNKEIQGQAEETATVIISENKELKASKHSLQNKETECDSVIFDKETQITQLRTENDKLNGKMADLQEQVNILSSDLIGTSEERNVTISNLEKIVYDKNCTITSLQSDITYLKSLVAGSENKLLDVSKELEQCRENCQQLSAQLKQCVGHKNEEINNLKKTLSKLSTTESSATQIIKVSAKYQAIILKRIAEIKSNTALRELTQFGNIDDKRKSIANGTVTVDELENFLEGTEKQMRKLIEKQSTMQKERDRFAEISKIHESEAFSVKKYLTELLAHFKTFSSIKEVYSQKLSQVISQQRMIRQEIYSLDQNIPDTVLSKLERSYGVVMQDLVETALNLSRWAERCIDRSISPEKLKQAFASSVPLLSTSQLQNASLEVQVNELMMAFRKVKEEVQQAKMSGGTQGGGEECSVRRVKAEYEDKLNRMKAKMKQLYQEQMSVNQAQHDAEVSRLQRQYDDKSKAYEEHIAGLTKELWRVGEKFLMKKEQVEWLQRRPSSSSLMSLQHVHSSGLGAAAARDARDSGRPTDTQSLRSVPAHKPAKSEGRGFHMSDEEGEVFDNRWLAELETPPRAGAARRRATCAGPAGAGRLSELQYRNSLCPPHLKSSYPAETHFASLPCNEDDIKFEVGAGAGGERRNRKEVGITAYKKPGPPTPSKNAGRLSATDSELRESVRPAGDEAPRKPSTPSRLRALFRSNRSDAENTSTPRSKRLSIFRKK